MTMSSFRTKLEGTMVVQSVGERSVESGWAPGQSQSVEVGMLAMSGVRGAGQTRVRARNGAAPMGPGRRKSSQCACEVGRGEILPGGGVPREDDRFRPAGRPSSGDIQGL